MYNPFDRTLWTFFSTLGLCVDCGKPFHPYLPKPQISQPSLWSMMQILLKLSRGAGLGNYFKYQKANFLNVLFKYLLLSRYSFPLPYLKFFCLSESLSQSLPLKCLPSILLMIRTTARRTVTETKGAKSYITSSCCSPNLCFWSPKEGAPFFGK